MAEDTNIIEKYEMAQNCKDIFTNQAARNQKTGGKGLTIEKSSKVNVRKKMASFCGISEDSYRKLDKVMKSENKILIEKLRNGEMKINQAFKALSDKIVVAKILNGLNVFEYTFSFISGRGQSTMICKTWIFTDGKEYLELVPEHLHAEFLQLYKECSDESYVWAKSHFNYKEANKSSSRSNQTHIKKDGESSYKQIWKKLYRDLAKIYHPDSGGDDEKMQALVQFNDYMSKIL